MVRAAYGLDSPPVSDDAKLDLRAHEEVESLLAELAAWIDLGGTLTREELFGALEHATVRLGSPGEAGRVAVVDLLRARTRRVEVVFVLGLEEGRLPRRAHPSPFIDDDLRRGVDERSRRAAHPTRRGLPRALLLLRGVHSTLGGCTSSAKRLPTKARPGRRARSGMKHATCSTSTTSPAGRSAGRSPRSPGRSTARQASGSGCVR